MRTRVVGVFMRSVSRAMWRAVLCVLVLALTACNAEILTTVEVEEDGSGTVEVAVVLDPELVGQLPDLEAAGLALADADDSGWVVEPSELDDDGRTRITSPQVRRPAIEQKVRFNTLRFRAVARIAVLRQQRSNLSLEEFELRDRRGLLVGMDRAARDLLTYLLSRPDD